MVHPGGGGRVRRPHGRRAGRLRQPYDPTRPKVNCDETTKQRIQETRQPLPAQPGRPQRYDDAYARNGTRNLLLFVEPQAGWRHVQVTAQRTKLDFAHALQWLVDEGYPEATVMRVVLDNLHTHQIRVALRSVRTCRGAADRSEAGVALHPQAREVVEQGCDQLSVLQQQCLDRRIPDEATLTGEIAAWEHQRDAKQATIDWRFSVTDARKKLKRLYPSLPA